MNYFEFYNIKPAIHIDEKELKGLYYDKMRELHPDMHVESDAARKDEALDLSSYNNEAYKTLKDFYKRLRYIVDTFSETELKKDMPQMFLMEMMDVNEEVMELQMDYDEKVAEKLRYDILEREEKMKAELSGKLDEIVIVDSLDDEISASIQEFLLKRNYLLRILENLDKFAPK